MAGQSGKDQDRRTIFVQGISFEITDNDFEEAFSEIGPIRKCFLLRQRGQQRHRGSGYVQFALPEDAARAVKEYNGKILLGRQVQVTQATKRAPLADRKQRKREEAEERERDQDELQPPPKRAKLQLMDDKQKALRTIALGGLPPPLVDQALKFAATVGKVEETRREISDDMQGAAKLRHDGCTGEVVLVTYKTIKAAVDAVAQLHGRALGKKKQSGPGATLWARQLKGEGAMVKKWRLILRNLPFNVKEEDLKGLLSPAGLVWEVTIPRKEDGSSKGFAFASFTSRAHAEKGIKLTNGKKVKGRLVAVDWAVSKVAFELGPLDALEGLQEEAAVDTETPFKEDQDQAKEVQMDPEAEKDFMRALANQIASEDGKPDLRGQIAGDKKAKAISGEAERNARADKAEAGPSSQAAAAATAAQGFPQRGIGRTVFVRGVGPDVTKQQLQARLESFGPIKACRLVINPVTKQPKGTAFVEFSDAANAKKVTDACARGRSGEGPGVAVGGLSLEIDIALTQDDARAMASGKAGSAGPKDKRNLYLAKEGYIEAGSAIWQDMSKGDQDKRSRANKEKTTKLRSPNFFISNTRLSLRNLPYTMDEKALKSLLVSVVKERATKARPNLKQVKVLRDPTRKDKEGKPQAKGIAFAEFSDHEHALCALRQLNNNPRPFGKDRRPIVEFAVENAQTVKKREQRLATTKGGVKTQQPKGAGTAGEGMGGPIEQEASEPKPKRQKKSKKERNGDMEQEAAQKSQGFEASHPPVKGKQKPSQQKSQNESKAVGGAKNKAAPKGTADGDQILRGAKQDVEISAERRKLSDSAMERKERHTDRIRERKEKKEKKQAKPEKTDGLDNLISKYRESLFGSGKSKQNESQQSSLKRWFE